MAPSISLLLLATPLVVIADMTTMSLVHPNFDSKPNSPYHWTKPSSPISMADVAQSSLRLMGVAPHNSVSAKVLPLPDSVSPPEAVLLLAIDSSTATTMPNLQKLLESGSDVQVKRSDMGFDMFMDQLGNSMTSFDSKWRTQCASVEALGSTVLCPESESHLLDSVESLGIKASKGSDNTWFIKKAQESHKFVSDEEVTLLDELASIESLAPTKIEDSFYLASLSASVAAPEKAEIFGRLADAVLLKKIKSLSEAHQGSLVVQVVQMQRARFLTGNSPTPAPTASTELTVQEISTYQICLWTGVGLVLALLSAICCMVNMDIRPDSLLYAKFQADVSSKSE